MYAEWNDSNNCLCIDRLESSVSIMICISKSSLAWSTSGALNNLNF